MSGRSAILTFSIIAMTLASLNMSLACVGTRPLAMGGAFTGLADDTNATYWNPAGLTQLQSGGSTWMRTITSRDEINYQDYTAVAAPMGSSSAMGVSWVRYNMAVGLRTDAQDWYWVSAATSVGSNTSLGMNIKEIRHSVNGLSTETGIDIGLLTRINNRVSAGVLVQNANRPSIRRDGDKIMVWERNWRPGVAYRPDETSVITMELYDAANETGSQSLRVGYEKTLDSGWAVRCGYYGLGMSDNSAFTVGVGKSALPDSANPLDVGIAAMIGDLNTVMGSLTVSF